MVDEDDWWTEERIARSLAVGDVYSGWVKKQLVAGVDGPVPAGRRDGSDYNQHVPLMEADGAAMDDLFRRIGQATS
jgi:hypothetical protein